ncbi:MAG: hypothetical protein JST61_13120 [Acidobacteria bacterium]|nr:hypothetical protein [Acidobacteriota bacterium]
MELFLLILLLAVPLLSLVVWHLAFLLAVNKHFADRRNQERSRNWVSG